MNASLTPSNCKLNSASAVGTSVLNAPLLIFTTTSKLPLAGSTFPALIVTPFGNAFVALILTEPPLGLTTLDILPFIVTLAAVPVATLIEAVVVAFEGTSAVASVASTPVNLNFCAILLSLTIAPAETPD